MFAFTVTGFGIVQVIMTIVVFFSSLFTYLHYKKKSASEKISRFFLFALCITFLSTIGIFVSETLITLFICFEIMSFASFVLLLNKNEKAKIDMTKQYLATSVITGMVMLMGIFMLQDALGTLNINAMSEAADSADKSALYIGGALTLVGFCTKAAMYPLHFWLPKTYYHSSEPITAIFSSVLSKAGVFGVIVVSANIFFSDEAWGNVLIVFALITMVWGGLCAIKSDDMKKTVAYSSMSQIGFIILGIAMNSILGSHNQIAASGVVLHMLNHSAFKLVLFTLCAVLMFNLKTTKLEKIKGIARKNKFFATFFIISAAGLMGIPSLSGYVSKTLLHESIVEHIHITHSSLFTFYEYVFLFSGGLTICYMLKITSFLFAKNKKAITVEIPIVAKISMGICSIFAVLGGVLPNFVMETIANFSNDALNAHAMDAVNYFSLVNLRGAGISIVFGITLYIIFMKSFLTKIIAKLRMWEILKLENIYYFVFIKAVPTILIGAFSVLSKLPEYFAIAFSIIFFKPAKEKNALGHVLFSYRFGEGIDTIAETFNIKTKRKFAEILSDLEQQSSIRRRMISASLSYGLFFAGAGIVGVLLYMLAVYL